MSLENNIFDYNGVSKAVYDALDFVKRAGGVLTPDISTLVTTGPAPLHVTFDATGSNASTVTDNFEDLLYVWDYDDAGATFENRPGVDANVSFGPIGGHVWETPGTKTVTLTIYDRFGNSNSTTIDITVQDPDVYYTDTYVCAFDGDFTGAPATSGSGTQITTFAQIDSIFAGMSTSSPPTRILMKRGTSATVFDGEQLDPRNTDNRLLLGAWGSGAKPRLIMDSAKTGYLFFGGMQKFTTYDIAVEGVYDPTTGTGNRVGAFFILDQSYDNLQYKCEFTKMSLNVYYAGNDNGNYHNSTVDCNITDWADYGRLGDGGHMCAIMGNSIKQNPSAISTSDGKSAGGPDHGCIRLGYPDRCIISQNDLFNNAGWSSAGLAHQPCIRIGTSATAVNTVVSDNICEGGYNNIENVVANGGITAFGMDSVLIERNKFIATANTENAIVGCYGGLIVRNNIAIKNENGLPPLGSGEYRGLMMMYKVAIDDASNLSTYTHIYNNTIICRNTSATATRRASILRIVNTFDAVDLHNNILYVANTEAANFQGLLSFEHATGLANVNADNNLIYAPDSTNYMNNNGTALNLATWRTNFSQCANSLESDPLFVNVSNDDGAILIGSPARNAGATMDGLIDDYNQDIRDSSPDIGAVEYS